MLLAEVLRMHGDKLGYGALRGSSGRLTAARQLVSDGRGHSRAPRVQAAAHPRAEGPLLEPVEELVPFLIEQHALQDAEPRIDAVRPREPEHGACTLLAARVGERQHLPEQLAVVADLHVATAIEAA